MLTVDDCINKIKGLNKGDEFTIETLFTKKERENATPTTLGKDFKKMYDDNNISSIRWVKTKTNNHHLYKQL